MAGVVIGSPCAAAERRVTFTRDIAPLVFEHCTSCHRPGDIAPFSLRTYREIRPRAAAIAKALRERRMPPWKPEPGYGGEFAGARRLTEPQIDLVQRWVEEGAIEGSPGDLPPLPSFPDGWRLGKPDLIVALDEPYLLGAGGADVLRSFSIPVAIGSARYVSGVEFRPGNQRVVHHANIRLDRSGGARRLDAADSAPGFEGRLTAGEFPDGYFLGWTPGQLPPRLPEGMAWRLDPGTDLVVQLHLHPVDTPQSVQPSIGLFFTDTPPTRQPLMLRLGRQNIDIAPGDPSYAVEDSYRLPVDASVYAVQPHAHFRAREINGFADLPDGSRRWLIRIKDWDFNWQDVYRYVTPVALPRGSTITMRYTYDNSSANRANPDRPPRRVRWGQNSSDEMGDLWLQVLPRTPEDRKRLALDFRPKVLSEDAAGYETILAGDPDNPRLHEAVASLDLTLGRAERAIEHLHHAIRSDPRSVEAHYNLGLAFSSIGQFEAALVEYERALALDPEHVAARINRGAVLRSQGRLDEAIGELTAALSRQPGNALAHTNLGGALAAQGRVAAAVLEYRRALEARPELLDALTSLAWMLATSPDARIRQPDEAVRLATRAAALAGDGDVRVLDTLAAAYAANGDFAHAVAILEPFVNEPLNEQVSRDAGLLRDRVALYRRRVAYRDPALAPQP
jgi:tetratricopeptide (TPR) repeat protein